MIATMPEVLEALRARGLVGDAVPATSRRAPRDRPWFVSLLLGAAGWLAGLFVLAFVFLAFELQKGAGAAVAGPVLLAAAWGLFAVDREGAFASQLALALSIAGQFLVLFGVGEALFHGSGNDGLVSLSIVALVLQLALLVAMPSALHRVMSTFFACIAWAVLVRFGLWDRAGWASGLHDAARYQGMAHVHPLVAWMVAWLPIAAALWILVRKEAAWMASRARAIARAAATGLVAGLALATLLSEPFEALRFVGSMPAASGPVAMWPLLSAIAALGALAAAFALGHRGLMALCIGAALAHVSHFYYAMGATLLLKSATMIVAGAAMLAAAWSLRREDTP